jgi:hypothetical protein
MILRNPLRNADIFTADPKSGAARRFHHNGSAESANIYQRSHWRESPINVVFGYAPSTSSQ